ncbi:MAG: hypothetical protein JWQ59_1788 [Cryobacterium sp.]|jgi:hypothetical protein|nr:hypothetical protein [Cryobacterium sp.]
MTDTPIPDRDDDQLPPLPDWGPTDGQHGTDADPDVSDENDSNSLGNGVELDRTLDQDDEQEQVIGETGA